ncbi:piggyBac transposable element-derived protein 3-like protein [Lates japonicus]|uniref:PiggyBac transposable element-derived protein 3-like protein n=1 Tax=Lates japonicus TaxID=270547 RepID=A0AAD3RES9_LATJO|nr:piggyBac transposable element-derived protein 3-like protein [Lates japonicus]
MLLRPVPLLWLSTTKTWVELNMCDCMISFYLMSSRPNKWTVHMVLYLFDLAATHSWMEYKAHHQVSGRPEKERLQYFDFKLLLAEEMITQAQGGRGQQGGW